MRNLKTGFVIAMVLLFTNSFGQSVKPVHTYLDLMVNVISTNLNYGSTNEAMAGYKRTSNGIQAGASFQAGITNRFSLVSEFYFIRKGGKLKMNNPLTTNESKLYLKHPGNTSTGPLSRW